MLIMISSHSVCMNVDKITTNCSYSNFRIYFTTMYQPQNFPLCIKSQFIRASDTDSSFYLSFSRSRKLSFYRCRPTLRIVGVRLNQTKFTNTLLVVVCRAKDSIKGMILKLNILLARNKILISKLN